MKPVLANITVVGPLIWCDNPHVRMSKISYINNNDFHNLGKSQMCAGGCCYFRPSKPHSGTLCGASFSPQDRQWWQRRIHPALHSLHHLQTFAETQSGTQVYLLSGAGVLHFIHSFYWASCTLRWQHMKGNSVICQMYSVTWFPRYWWEAIWNITRKYKYKVIPADCRINRSGCSGSINEW